MELQRQNRDWEEKQNRQERKYQEMQLALSAVDEILENISAFDSISSREEMNEAMPKLLASMGRYSMADRAYVFTWASAEREVLRMTHEWCADGVRPTFGMMQNVRMSDMPNWAPKLENGEAIVSMDWEADKEKTPEEYALFDGQDIHSLIVIPIFANRNLNGYIGFDNPGQEKTALSVRLLTSVGGHIGGLKENLYMMDELEKKQQSLQKSLAELSQEKKILDALSIDYTSVYYCDLEADTIMALKQGAYTNSALTEKELTSDGRQQSYSFRVRYYFENFVIPESAPDFVQKLSAEYLKAYLAEHERFAYRFRAKPNSAGQQYFEVQIVQLMGAGGFKTVMGYRYIDDIVEEQERQKMQLENALAKVTLNSEIIGSISKIYWLIYRMDLVKGTYEEISAKDEMHRLTGKRGNTVEAFREARANIVSEEHQEMMERFMDPDTLPERLQDTDSVAAEYRASSGSWHLARFIVKKRDENGRVTNVLYAVCEIDKQKQQELEYQRKILETAEDARRANLAKTDFLRRMSHDIRTPINGIQGMVAIAEHFPDDMEKQKECRDKVKEASGFLLELVNSVLDMNKLESGRVVLEHEPFNLLTLLEEVNQLAEMNGQLRGLKITTDHRNVQHIHLFGSTLHLKQILLNIAGNAVKYNKNGGSIAFSTEEISCENKEAVFRFTCSDTGRGMSQEFLQHAFEPFAQEEHSARTSYMGTGLGLAIVKQLVEMMGGRIEVKSKQNVGTTFRITLPFELNEEYKKDQQEEVEVPDNILEGKQILLAEDNELNMEIAEFMLENAGVVVTPAKNGAEAVKLFMESKEHFFDLILMDVMMPVLDGLAAVKQIRALERSDAKKIPIFAMTANAFAEDIERSREAGMNEHLCKPLNEKKLLQAIRQYLMQKRK